MLRQSGGATYSNGRPIRMMGKKIGELRNRMSTDVILKGQLNNGKLLDDLVSWKDNRDILMHAMADGSMSIDEIEKEIYLLGQNGKNLTRNIAAAARRLKKQKLKT